MKAFIKANTFRSFQSRNYALYFTGRSVSQIGTWMQRTAVSWVVYTLTHSTFMLGMSAFASQFPSFLFSLLGGVVADRYNRHKLLIITQISSMVQAVLLAVLVLTNHYTVWQILALSVVLGIINAFDVPARQSMVNEMVNDKDDLPNALALNSSINNFARLIGPALSGLILARFGAGTCFLLNAVSFVAVLISLLLIKWPPYQPSPLKKDMGRELSEGFAYLKNNPAIGSTILMLALVSLLVLPYNTLLPVFAKEIFKGDAATFGYINSFIGLGAIAGVLFLASLKPTADLKLVLLINTVIFGICLILFSRTVFFPMAMFFATVGGFGMTAQTTISNTIVQVNTDKQIRGRILGIFIMAYFGMLPLGSLLVGAVSQKIGAPNTMLCQGVIALLIAAIFFKFLKKETAPKAFKPTVELNNIPTK